MVLGNKSRLDEIKRLEKRIEEYLESTVRGVDFYTLHKPRSIKEEMFDRELNGISQCFSHDSPFKTDLDRLTPEEARQLENKFIDRACKWHTNVTLASPISTNIREFKEKVMDVEKNVLNLLRQNMLHKVSYFYGRNDHNSVRDELDSDVKKMARRERDLLTEDKDYFNMNNSEYTNKKLFKRAMEAVEYCYSDNSYPTYKDRCTEEEFAEMKKDSKDREKLMDKLRRMGPNFSVKEMKDLAALERSSFAERGEMVGIVELGRINEELGIIKDDADRVFPEWTRVREYIHKQDREAEVQKRNLAQWQEQANAGGSREGNASQERKAPEAGRDR
jgi:hypothetical protein